MRPLVFVAALFLAAAASAAELTTADGAVLRYETYGKGDVVFVLSGGPGFASDYMLPLAKHIAAKHQAVLLDQRGTGRSTVPVYDASTINVNAFVGDLEALRAKLGAETVTLVGHSWGGMLSMSYAAAHPERVRALVLVDSGGPDASFMFPFVIRLNARNTAEDTAKINEWSSDERRTENPRRAVMEITKARTPAYFHDRSKAHLMMDPLTESSFEPRVLEWMLKSLQTWSVSEPMKAFKAPVLVLEGDDDPVGTFNQLRDLFPGDSAAMIAAAGHFPWLEQPGQFWAAVDSFLDATPAAPARK